MAVSWLFQKNNSSCIYLYNFSSVALLTAYKFRFLILLIVCKFMRNSIKKGKAFAFGEQLLFYVVVSF